jgi:toxin ParE1/3/4
LSAPNVLIRAAARADLADHYRWLATEAGIDTAERFLAAADREFAKLAGRPGLGVRLRLSNRHLARLRKWRVDGFENVLIFYERRAAGVSIVRVIHAARDWWRLVGVMR